MTQRYRYPKTVTLYEPSDFCGGILHVGNGEDLCCMLGWAAHVFGRIPLEDLNYLGNSKCFYSLPAMVIESLIATMPQGCWRHGRCAETIFEASDGSSEEILSRWWRRFLKYLGYTEAVTT